MVRCRVADYPASRAMAVAMACQAGVVLTGIRSSMTARTTPPPPDIDGMRTAAAAPVMQHRDNEKQAGDQNRTGGDRHGGTTGPPGGAQESEEPSGDGSRHQHDHGQQHEPLVPFGAAQIDHCEKNERGESIVSLGETWSAPVLKNFMISTTRGT